MTLSYYYARVILVLNKGIEKCTLDIKCVAYTNMSLELKLSDSKAFLLCPYRVPKSSQRASEGATRRYPNLTLDQMEAPGFHDLEL